MKILFQLYTLKFSISIMALLIVFVFTSCKDNKEYTEVEEIKEMSDEDYIDNGEYLVEAMGCHDCHSPKRMGERGLELIPELILSGFQANDTLPEIPADAVEKGWHLMNHDLTGAVGPWGASFAANLTSDDTGIGTWSLEQFERALTEGKFKGLENGRTLLPPMPWQNYRNLKDDDIKSIFAYLQSTNPVENIVPSPVAPDKLGEL